MSSGIDLSQLSQLTRLADPKKAAAALSAGLPTLDLDAFKKSVGSMLEAKANALMTNVTSMVGGIMGSADKLIETQLSALENLDPSTVEGRAAQQVIANINNAKQYAVSSGNFIPLLKLTNPDLQLPNIPDNILNPDFKKELGDQLKKLPLNKITG